MIALAYCWDCGAQDDLKVQEIQYEDEEWDTVALCLSCENERKVRAQ